MNVSVYFNKQRQKADGSIPISLCVSRPPHRFYINTGLSSHTVFDDVIFPRSEKNHRAKSVRLSQMIDDTEEVLIANSLLPLTELKEKIRQKVFGEQPKTKYLHEYIYDFMQTKSNGTYDVYKTTYKHVMRFDLKATLDIDFHWLERFEEYLRNDGKKVNSISINLRNIRAVMNHCRKNDLTTNYPFDKYSIQNEATRKRNVPLSKIREIRDMQLPRYLERYRDFFMLSFYLIGVNLKDLIYARHDQVEDGRFYYNRAKTKKEYSIKIEPEAQEILERLKGKDYLISFCDTATYKSLKSRINQNLKFIMPKLSTYYARHSWATIAYSLGISKDIISQSLGHSSGCSVTEIYLERDYRLVDEANRKVIDALNEML